MSIKRGDYVIIRNDGDNRKQGNWFNDGGLFIGRKYKVLGIGMEDGEETIINLEHKGERVTSCFLRRLEEADEVEVLLIKKMEQMK